MCFFFFLLLLAIWFFHVSVKMIEFFCSRCLQVLLGLSDAELESGMGVTNVLHRRKIRLAVEEQRPGVEK